MYRTLRNIHLAVALLGLPFLLVYAFSAIQMTHRGRPKVRQQRIKTEPGRMDGRELARELMERQGLKGELQQVANVPRGYRLRITRPGTSYDIDYTRESGEIYIRTTTSGFLEFMSGLHRSAGFWHGYRPVNWWSVAVVWASAAILLMGISGVWMWFVRSQDRIIGVILLAINLGAGLTLLLLIRFA